ncbi:lytic transglycosylase domain-containing protein [Paenibacillus albiflavus]|uniref:Lytic transglycosylase domain-containing protein n=1 Tax=Paenibacillus albiflavus TaxID=2545760 RepID=A0A4R4E6G7_9BACL|nr:lytic transglycosylase domain-containing protein [Paenibacillus albiflavus]TCZ75286.1 lytic transglycosylase domain-containing protein [Paenibacillus albiflavus]
MNFVHKKRTYAILLIAVLLFLLIFSNKIEELLYPIDYRQEISTSASKYNVDPFLIAAIIRVENNFKVEGTSSKGALGLMQLMPETAQWIKESSNIGTVGSDHDLQDASVNIDMGAWYLSWLLNYYDGHLNYAIAAYNAGQGTVNKWRATNVWDGSETSISTIPYGQTKHFVKRVRYYYDKYHKVYGPDLKS